MIIPSLLGLTLPILAGPGTGCGRCDGTLLVGTLTTGFCVAVFIGQRRWFVG